jgi:hypothetical protein
MPETRPKFRADENVRDSIVEGLRQHEPIIDILTARESGTLGFSDPDVLVIHSREGRVLLSSESNTMVGHLYAFVNSGARCPGLIIIPQNLPDETLSRSY